MLPTDIIVPGASKELALACFAARVNQPGTIFSTGHWLQPKLTELRSLLRDPLPADQAEALLDVLFQRHWMSDLIEWLKFEPPVAWTDFFKRRDELQRERSWRTWQERHELNAAHEAGVDPCPRCGLQNVVAIMYGYPSNDAKEAARRGRIVLGGCMVEMKAPNWHCQACSHQCGAVLQENDLEAEGML